MKRWSKEDLDFLKANYSTLGKKRSAEALGRTENSIRRKASDLGLRSNVYKTAQVKTNEQYIIELGDSEYIPLEPYIRSQTPILHKHKSCGYTWKVSPNNVLTKLKGCPNCSKSGFKPKIPHIVYIAHFPVLDLFKVGITSNWEKRKHDFGYTADLLYSEFCSTGEKAIEVEQYFLSNLTPYLVNTQELKSGNTETFIWPS